jgi:hypothetical protein
MVISSVRRPNVWIDRLKSGHDTVYKTPAGDSRSVDSERVDDWKNKRLLQDIKDYDLCDIYKGDETGLFFNLQHSKCLTFCGDPWHGGTKSKQ